MYKTMVFTTVVVLLMSTVAPAAIWQSQQTQAGHMAGTSTAGVYGVARQNNTSTAAAEQRAAQGVYLGSGGVAAGNTARQTAYVNINNRSYTQSFFGAATTFFWGYATTNQQQLVTP